MRKKVRKILFLICLVLFLLVSPLVVLYSQGYRLNFNPPTGRIKITQTGGLFLKAWPRQVEIYLDSKLVKKTDWFFGSVFIENLLPKKYKVLVKKDGFHLWEKTLEIKEKEVTEAKNIVLWPQNPNFSLVSQGVESFWFSPDQKKIILLNEESEKEGWSLKLYDVERGIQSYLVTEKEIHPQGAELLNLDFSVDSKRVSLEIGAAERIKYFDLEIDRIPPTLVEEEPPFVPLDRVIAYQKLNDDVYYLNNFGHLFKTNLSFESQTKISEKPFALLPETEYQLKVCGDFIFLKEGENLYIFNSESKTFEKFFSPFRGLRVSPNSEKLMYWSDSEIWILFLKKGVIPSPEYTEEKLFLVRLSEKINDVIWLNSDYFAFILGNMIKITETDTRDRLNIIDFATLEKPQMFFNTNNQKLYILSGGNLQSSPKLLP